MDEIILWINLEPKPNLAVPYRKSQTSSALVPIWPSSAYIHVYISARIFNLESQFRLNAKGGYNPIPPPPHGKAELIFLFLIKWNKGRVRIAAYLRCKLQATKAKYFPFNSRCSKHSAPTWVSYAGIERCVFAIDFEKHFHETLIKWTSALRGQSIYWKCR